MLLCMFGLKTIKGDKGKGKEIKVYHETASCLGVYEMIKRKRGILISSMKILALANFYERFKVPP